MPEEGLEPTRPCGQRILSSFPNSGNLARNHSFFCVSLGQHRDFGHNQAESDTVQQPSANCPIALRMGSNPFIPDPFRTARASPSYGFANQPPDRNEQSHPKTKTKERRKRKAETTDHQPVAHGGFHRFDAHTLARSNPAIPNGKAIGNPMTASGIVIRRPKTEIPAMSLKVMKGMAVLPVNDSGIEKYQA